MDQPGKVANPASGQLNRKNYFPCPRACLRIWSRETVEKRWALTYTVQCNTHVFGCLHSSPVIASRGVASCNCGTVARVRSMPAPAFDPDSPLVLLTDV